MSPTVPLSGVARARTLLFLEHRKLWPMWPFLPLVRRRPGCEEELGVLFDSLNAFAYREVSAIAVIIIVAVSLIDLLSQAMRSRLL